MARSTLSFDFLTADELKCLSMYYFDGKRQREIAKVLGVTRPRISQILDSGRTKLAERGMEPKRPERADRPKLHTMDPARMDRLGPGDVKALW